jgi:hypothetical protein
LFISFLHISSIENCSASVSPPPHPPTLHYHLPLGLRH